MGRKAFDDFCVKCYLMVLMLIVKVPSLYLKMAWTSEPYQCETSG